jgi:hypothetical protein
LNKTAGAGNFFPYGIYAKIAKGCGDNRGNVPKIGLFVKAGYGKAVKVAPFSSSISYGIDLDKIHEELKHGETESLE